MNNQHHPNHTPADEPTITRAWQEQLVHAFTRPPLVEALRHHAPPTLYTRFARAYRDLVALKRPRRRTLLRRMGLSLGGAALAVALGLSPAPAAHAASISVGGSCTLVDAITAANTDTATGGCVAGSGPTRLRSPVT